jgi:hypothetical protein
VQLWGKTTGDDIDAGKVECLNLLLSRPWIQRAWTWQEMVLAREAFILCGSKSLSWHRFIFALSVLDLCSHHAKVERVGEFSTRETSMVGTLADKSKAYFTTRRLFSNGYHVENLKSWCLLSECWLRFDRSSSSQLGEKGGKQEALQEKPCKQAFTKIIDVGRQSFLDLHYRTYLVAVRIMIVISTILFSVLIAIIVEHAVAPILDMANDRDSVEAKVSPGSIVLFIFPTLLSAWVVMYSFNVFFRLHGDIKKYRKLSIAFAMIPNLRGRKATDPRDLCYGFYGVLEAEGASHLSSPDYTRDPRSVFRDFFLDLLQWDSAALVLLLDCCNFSHPSWSPDWRVATEQSWLDERYFYGMSLVSATPNSLPQCESTDGNCILLVLGLKARNAVVNCLAPDLVVNSSANPNHNLEILLDWIGGGTFNASEHQGSISIEQQVRIFETLEGMVAMRSTDAPMVENDEDRCLDFKALVALSNGFTSWFKIVKRYLRSSDVSGARTSGQSLAAMRGTNNQNRSSRCYRRLLKSERALAYHQKICSKIAGKRRLFLLSTSNGVEFGTGSPATQIGDQVVLISGLAVPMLLRDTATTIRYTSQREGDRDEAFSVVGPAFIPSMMRGEAWPKEKGNRPLPANRLQQLCLI